MPTAITACVFDAYGTLFDVGAPVTALQAELGPGANEISALWRAKQVRYTWLRSLMERYVPFDEVTADALDYALNAHGLGKSPVREKLLALFQELTPYSDAKSCLERLKAIGLRTGILSNGSPRMLASAVTAAGLGALLDYVLSVDTVRVYKPSPQVYMLAPNAFGVEPQRIAFVSGNAWDCAGAATVGFTVVHVNRHGQPEERLGSLHHAAVKSLTAAATWLAART